MQPLVAAWTRGEGTQAEIAAKHGMPMPTFSWWCQRLARKAAPPGRFVAVDVGPAEIGDSDGAFEILLELAVIAIPGPRDLVHVEAAVDLDLQAVTAGCAGS